MCIWFSLKHWTIQWIQLIKLQINTIDKWREIEEKDEKSNVKEEENNEDALLDALETLSHLT